MILFLSILLTINLTSCKPDDCPPELVGNTSPIVWKKAFEKTDLSSTPMFYNGTIIVGHPSVDEIYKVYAYDALTGDTIWQTAINMLGNFEPNFKEEVFLVDDKVILSEAHDLCVLNANTGEIIWFKIKQGLESKCCEIDGFLYRSDYVNRNTSSLYRFDINTGAEETVFTINRSEYGSNYSPGLLMPVKWEHPSGDEILVLQNRTYGWYTGGSDKMDILAWNLTADSMLWYRDSLDGLSSTSRPALDGNKVYFFGTWNVYCIDAKTGETLWNYDVGISPGGNFKTANILIVDDKLIAKQGNDGMHAVNKETGERIWYNPDTEASPSLLTVHNDTIWFCSAGVFGIDAHTGEKLIDDWNPEYGAWIFSVAQHPTNGNIYTSDASYLYCLNPKYMK